jgi:hypothetical protein
MWEMVKSERFESLKVLKVPKVPKVGENWPHNAQEAQG